MEYTTEILSNHIYNKLKTKKDQAKIQYSSSKDQVGYFIIDDLFPTEIAKECFKIFPSKAEMTRLKSIREYKYVSAQMNKHHVLLEQMIYAFQNEKVVRVVEEICNIKGLEPDQSLYAGGLSLMAQGNFLHPHLDNSHDSERNRWRVLNLLYYVTPDWETENGGHLELWPDGPKHKPIQLESKFNRLIVMATHDQSWHSVNQVKVDQSRCCISNYYFNKKALRNKDKFHVTKFRGRPENKITDTILSIDASIRMLVRKIFTKGIRKNPHVYKKDD